MRILGVIRSNKDQPTLIQVASGILLRVKCRGVPWKGLINCGSSLLKRDYGLGYLWGKIWKAYSMFSVMALERENSDLSVPFAHCPHHVPFLHSVQRGEQCCVWSDRWTGTHTGIHTHHTQVLFSIFFVFIFLLGTARILRMTLSLKCLSRWLCRCLCASSFPKAGQGWVICQEGK